MTEPPPNYPPPPGGGSYPPPPPSSGGYPQPAPAGYGYPPAAPGPGTNGMAIASLVCSLALWVCFGLGSILGIVFGFVALNQIKQSGQNGRGLALAGIIVGAVSIVGGILWWVFVILLAVNSPNTNNQQSGAPATVIVVAPQVVSPALVA